VERERERERERCEKYEDEGFRVEGLDLRA
jgi:hypothetical protein